MIGGTPAKTDLSSPKSAATDYLKAIQRADAATARSVCIGSWSEMRWVDAQVSLVDGMRRFDSAMSKTYRLISSQIHTDMFDALRALADEPVDLMTDAKVAGDDENARIDPGRHGFTSHYQPSIYLHHEKSGWKVDLRQTYAAGVPADQMAKVNLSYHQYDQMGDIFRIMSQDVLAHSYRTPELAVQSLQKRLAELQDAAR